MEVVNPTNGLYIYLCVSIIRIQTTKYEGNKMKVENIQKATVNGRKVKLFSVRDSRGVYAGQYSAPVKTANKDLLKFVK